MVKLSAWKCGGVLAIAFATTLLIAQGFAQPPGKGMGKGKGRNDPTRQEDMEVFHFLLDHRADIHRQIKEIPAGVETVTESDKPDITDKIQEHVVAMHKRVREGRGIHLRDPLFAELFRNYDKIKMTYEKTEKGVKVVETSEDPKVAKMIQSHAKVVSKFIENGHAEMRKNHPVPD